MPDLKILEVLPNTDNFHLFEVIPKRLYPENSPRFALGHDPVSSHLTACFIVLDSNMPVARCAFYENPTLHFQRKKIATIGSFECVDDLEVAQFLILHVREVARSKGYEMLIGPMEGSTWNNYRFSDHNRQPNFFMEPYHHDYYGQLWKECGFRSIARYISNLDTQLSFEPENIEILERKLASQGAVMRSIDLNNLDDDLRKIARFNNDAFKENFLFTPISENDFVAKYRQLDKFFDPELIWIVENPEGEIHALSFSIPDYMDALGKTLIIKSLARKKETPYKGIGSYLASKTYEMARKRNFERVIHALMIQDNNSVKLSTDFEGDSYKSYTLYGQNI